MVHIYCYVIKEQKSSGSICKNISLPDYGKVGFAMEIKLIKAEFFKLKRSTGYKVLFVIYLVMEILIQINNISNSIAYPKYNPAYTGGEWLLNQHQPSLYCDWCAMRQEHLHIPRSLEWLLNDHYTAIPYMIAVFLFVAFYVKGEFTAHTFYRGSLFGIPRKNIFGAKLIALFAGVIPLMLVSTLSGTVLWSIYSGFGIKISPESVFLIAKTFGKQIVLSLMLISHAVLFAVISKNQIGTFAWSIGTLYVVPRASVRAGMRFVLSALSVFFLKPGITVATALLELLIAGYIFERDLH